MPGARKVASGIVRSEQATVFTRYTEKKVNGWRIIAAE
jgi:hypothetical protein